MMALITTPNSNADSQNTLRVSKKLTTVCSGKRSRFSKPRPNLSISKRGDSNVSASSSKTSTNPVADLVKIENSNIDTNKTSEKCVSQSTSITVVDDKSCNVEEHQSNGDTNKRIIEDDVTIFSHEDTNKKTVEWETKILSCEVPIKFAPEEYSEVISSSSLEKLTSNKDSPVITKTTTETRDLEGDSLSDAIAEKSASKENVTSVTVPITSTENDIQSSPVKNSGPPLKAPESEKRSISSITPTVIDKSKYPHLTSILSKKRTEPRKEVLQKRRKKFKKGDAPPERSKMTMADLIYWNPAKTDESRKSAVTEIEIPIDNDTVEEECVDDVDESENNVQNSVPKLVISADGQINIDESSLYVTRNVTQPTSTQVVRKDDTTYSSFRKRPLTKHWTAKDTANFYRALSLVGADFSLMEQIFPNRTRRELKHKFKREEKYNIDIINKVLYESQTFDEFNLNDFIDQNTNIDEPDAVNEEDDLTVVKEKSSKQTLKKAKSTDTEVCDSSIDHLEVKTEGEKSKTNRGKKKKTKKLSDDEDVEILVNDFTSYNGTDEDKGSKRKRNAKQLPDGFISIDSIEIFEHDESNSNDSFQKEDSAENSNDVEAENNLEKLPSESACTILNKILNCEENTDFQQNLEEETRNVIASLPCEENTDFQQNLKEETRNVIVSVPCVTNDHEQYVEVEYIKSGDSDANLTMLSDVMAYEVVNTQTPIPKKRRKINSISPGKTRESFISPTNYTNYTPV